MSGKLGNLITRGTHTWLVRVSLDRDPEIKRRKYLNKTIRGSFREVKTYLNARLQERDIVRLPLAATTRNLTPWRWPAPSYSTSMGTRGPK